MQLRFATLLLVMLSYYTFAQAPVDRVIEHVNQYNGNYQHTIPVMNVKGPNGELFPLISAYTSGIGVDQEASWIGLGWDMNLGEIKRKLNGAPDDCNGEAVTQIELKANGSLDEVYVTHTYGPLYYHNYNALTAAQPTSSGNVTTTHAMDIYQSRIGLSTQATSFTHPDYDEFYVSAPGFAGTMQFHMFQYANLHTNPLDYDDTDDQYWTYLPNSTTSNMQPNPGSDYLRFINWQSNPSARPQLKMVGVDATKAVHPNPSNFNGSLSLCDENQFPKRFLTNGNFCFKSPQDYASSAYTGDLIPNSKRLKGKYHIQYFTNSELSNPPSGFIEATSSGFVRSALVASRPNDIGAIQVTTPEGITYHYSLPVYTHGDTARSFSLNSSNQAGNPLQELQLIAKPTHVSSWKLTAITNYLYKDRGAAGFDEADLGYWVEIRYNKWMQDYNITFPFYGYNIGLETDAFEALDLKRYYGKFHFYKTYSNLGSNSTIRTELYYPEYVRTAEQTAFFFKSARRDAHSDLSITTNSVTAKPKLKLDRIVLANTGDINYGSIVLDQQPQLPSSRFIQGLPSILNTGDYLANKALIDQKAIKQVVFDYSYKLAKGYYNNEHSHKDFSPANYIVHKNTYNASGTNYKVRAFTTFQSQALSNNINSGKLTLEKITFIDRKNFAGTPPYTFEYSDRDGLNPRYDHLKKTTYGYHLNTNATTSGFLLGGNRNVGTLSTSSFGTGNKEAWSIATINEPSGTAIDLTYEDDVIATTSGQNYARISVSEFFITDVVHITPSKVYYRFNDPAILAVLQSIGTGTVRLNIRIPVTCTNTAGATLEDVLIANDVPFEASTLSNYDGELSLNRFDRGNCNGTPIALSVSNWTNDTGPAYVRISFKEGVKSGGTRVKEISLRDRLTGAAYRARFSYTDGVAPHFPSNFKFSGNWEDPLAINTASGDRHAPSSSNGYKTSKVTRLAQDNTPMSSVRTTFVDSYTPYSFSLQEEVYAIVNTQVAIPDFIGFDKFQRLRCTYVPGKEGRVSKKEYLDANGNIQSYQKYNYDDVDQTSINELFYVETTNAGWGTSPGGGKFLRIRSIHQKQIITTTLSSIVSYENESEVTEQFREYDKVLLEPTAIVFTGGGISRTENRSFYPYHYSDTEPKQKIKFLKERKVSSGLSILNGVRSTVTTTTPVLKLAANGAPGSQTYDWRQNRKLEVAHVTRTLRNGYKLEEVNTLYDLNGKPLESYNALKKQYSAVKYTEDDKILCQSNGANYTSQTFSSFEQYYTWQDILSDYNQPLFDGGVVKGDAIRVSNANQVRSGAYALSLPNNSSNKTRYIAPFNSAVSLTSLGGASNATREPGLQTNRMYKASVWINSNSTNCGVTIKLYNNQGSVISTATSSGSTFNINGWHKHEAVLDIPNSGSNLYGRIEVELFNQTGGSVIADDFMVMPNGSDLKGYVYNAEGLAEFEFNSENLRMKYEYDLAGRVTSTWMDTEVGLKKIKEKKYMLK